MGPYSSPPRLSLQPASGDAWPQIPSNIHPISLGRNQLFGYDSRGTARIYTLSSDMSLSAEFVGRAHSDPINRHVFAYVQGYLVSFLQNGCAVCASWDKRYYHRMAGPGELPGSVCSAFALGAKLYLTLNTGSGVFRTYVMDMGDVVWREPSSFMESPPPPITPPSCVLVSTENTPTARRGGIRLVVIGDTAYGLWKKGLSTFTEREGWTKPEPTPHLQYALNGTCVSAVGRFLVVAPNKGSESPAALMYGLGIVTGKKQVRVYDTVSGEWGVLGVLPRGCEVYMFPPTGAMMVRKFSTGRRPPHTPQSLLEYLRERAESPQVELPPLMWADSLPELVYPHNSLQWAVTLRPYDLRKRGSRR
ncbi:hypothetical protein KIPB_008236 [Kipferlia bialata]|uniref:Uncharacterized protein n=1 Tax=Kipferlia bialata TaxID=797122 RepID=A0A9K3D0D9_9EUKA|nr:hypothetical protein KIPB_008236 [Kipferlia bialata]|eukprot:g8236.t1